MFKSLIASVLFAVSFAASAADVWVSGMAASYHTDRSANYNESNPGIGLEIDPEGSNFKYVLNVYRNSFKDTSVLAAAAWTPIRYEGYRVGVVAGAVTGYPQYHGNPGPMGAAILAYEGKKYGFNLIYVPPLGGEKVTSVSTVQVKMRF